MVNRLDKLFQFLRHRVLIMNRKFVAAENSLIDIFLQIIFIYFNIHLGTRNLWPFLILVEAGPALISLVVLPCLPETPRYLLLSRGDRTGAAKCQFTRITHQR